LTAEASHVVTDIRSASCPRGVRVGRGRHARDPQGSALRRRPARIVEGRKEGGYRDAFEVICCDCGDHPHWDYSEISLSLQPIRGPYATMAAALAAYDQHLGLTTARRRS
jgi:hypothetical protein